MLSSSSVLTSSPCLKYLQHKSHNCRNSSRLRDQFSDTSDKPMRPSCSLLSHGLAQRAMVEIDSSFSAVPVRSEERLESSIHVLPLLFWQTLRLIAAQFFGALFLRAFRFVCMKCDQIFPTAKLTSKFHFLKTSTKRRTRETKKRKQRTFLLERRRWHETVLI